MIVRIYRLRWSIVRENSHRSPLYVSGHRKKIRRDLRSIKRSSTGIYVAVQESQLQCWKRFSGTGKSTSVLELIFQYRKVNFSAGVDFPAQESQL
jgi:hypothetical protein